MLESKKKKKKTLPPPTPFPTPPPCTTCTSFLFPSLSLHLIRNFVVVVCGVGNVFPSEVT